MRRCALAALLALSCGCAPPRSRDTVTVGVSALRISLPIFVAQERGFFTDQGLDVELRRYETAQPLVEELLDGRIDAGGFAALPIVLTTAAQDGDRVRVALAIIEDAEHPISALVRRRGDDSLDTVSDLRGRRIGILPTIAYRRWLELVLRHAGLDPSEVTIVPLAPPAQVAALAERGVDALFTGDPMATAAIAAGVGETFGPRAPVPAATGEPLVFGSFLVHPELAEERPRTARRLLAALDHAVAAIEDDQDAARAAMASFVRPTERPHIARYPDARYLPSTRFGDAELAAAVRSMVDLGAVAEASRVDGWTLSASEAR